MVNLDPDGDGIFGALRLVQVEGHGEGSIPNLRHRRRRLYSQILGRQPHHVGQRAGGGPVCRSGHQ